MSSRIFFRAAACVPTTSEKYIVCVLPPEVSDIEALVKIVCTHFGVDASVNLKLSIGGFVLLKDQPICVLKDGDVVE